MVDSLDELIVDESKEPDLDILAKILKGNAELTTEGKLNFSEEFFKYPDWKKIMIYLIGRKAVVIKKLNKEMKESVMPGEIGKHILVSGENVGKRLSRELKIVVTKNKDGYFVPNYRLLKCKSMLETIRIKKVNK